MTSLSTIPYKEYGYEYGGTPSENAEGYMIAMAKQQVLNNSLTGGSKRHYKKRMKGGAEQIVLPDVPNAGISVSPQNANSVSFALNKLFINSTNDSKYDNLVGVTQPGITTGGSGSKTNKYKRKKTKKNKRKSLINKRLKKARKSRKSRKSRK